MQGRHRFHGHRLQPDPPFPLEYILRDTTGPDGGDIASFGSETAAIAAVISGRARLIPA